MNPIQLPQIPQVNTPWNKPKPNLSVSLFGKPKTNMTQANMSYGTPTTVGQPASQVQTAPAPQAPAGIKYGPWVGMPKEQMAAKLAAESGQNAPMTQPQTAPMPQQPPMGTNGQPHYNVPAPQPVVPINEQLPTLGNRDISKMSYKELSDFKTSLDTAYNRRQTELEGQGRGISLSEIQGQQGVIERIRQGETAGLEAAIAGKKEEEASRRSTSGGGGGSNLDELLSIAEAKSLGVPYGTTRGEAIGSRSLTAEQREAQTNANSALMSLRSIQDKIQKGNGGIKGRGLFTPLGLSKTAFDKRELRDVITRIRTGAALNASEEKFYKKQVPRYGESDATIKAKVNQLAAFYSGVAGNPVTLQLPTGEVVVADDMMDESTRADVRQALSDGAEIINY